MPTALPRIILESCPKGYTRDLDKAVSPADTLARVRSRMAQSGKEILASTRRVDVGRLGIPVYMSMCGADARAVMPTRKQMGKGSSPEQAQASAVMELMERFAFFSFWDNKPHMVPLSWKEAKQRFGNSLLPIATMLASVEDNLEEDKAEQVLDLCRWNFYPATHLLRDENVWLPLDWFKLLNEFNGTSAGNSNEESLLQGISELVERHVCCQIDRNHMTTPTIDATSCNDPILQQLLASFAREGITLILKDFSLGMPLPTVGALAWDASTFPDSSEIVFTAGTAASPAKAAIRAVTEVAQLAGDFCTNACYEASGLGKFKTIEETTWLQEGRTVSLASLPSVLSTDIREEVLAAIRGLAPLEVYALATTHPQMQIPAHYTIIPGLSFRERDKNQSLGLFVGRKLVEESDMATALEGLQTLERCYPKAHFLPFFQGMLAMRADEHEEAQRHFRKARDVQPDNESRALTAFYDGYIDTLQDRWADAIPALREAQQLCVDMKEYSNLLGVAYYKTGQYAEAAEAFAAVLRIDKGSAMDLANLGVCEKMQGLNAQAREHLEAALALDASLDFARAHLAALEQ